MSGNSLAVQWLGLHALTAKGLGSLSCQRTKIPQVAQQKKIKQKILLTSWTSILPSNILQYSHIIAHYPHNTPHILILECGWGWGSQNLGIPHLPRCNHWVPRWHQRYKRASPLRNLCSTAPSWALDPQSCSKQYILPRSPQEAPFRHDCWWSMGPTQPGAPPTAKHPSFFDPQWRGRTELYP